MYNELTIGFPDHTHFYEVGNMTMGEALDRCARMTGDDGQVLNYQGKIVFAVKHALDTNEISWLNPVAGSPIDVDVSGGE